MMTATRLLLLVEDNPDDEEVTLRALRSAGLEDCVINVVRDGQEALDWLQRDRLQSAGEGHRTPNLILLDLSLPRVPGLEVLKQIRADERTALTPVVILTSSLEQTDRVRGYVEGANSYVQKPIKYADFLEAVRQLGIYWANINQTV